MAQQPLKDVMSFVIGFPPKAAESRDWVDELERLDDVAAAEPLRASDLGLTLETVGDDPRDADDRAATAEAVRELLLRDAPASDLDLVEGLDPVDLAAAIHGLSHSLRRLVRRGPTVWRADGSVSVSTDGDAQVIPRADLVAEVRQYLIDGAAERTIERSDSVVTWIERLAHRRPHVLAFVAATPVEGGLLLTRVDPASRRPDADRWADVRPVTPRTASASG